MNKAVSKRSSKINIDTIIDKPVKKTLNTIMKTLVGVILLTVAVVSILMYSSSMGYLNNVEKDLSADLISRLPVFDNLDKYVNSDSESLLEDLNYILGENYVGYVVVFDKNMEPVHSSLLSSQYKLEETMSKNGRYKLVFEDKMIGPNNVNYLKTIQFKVNDYTIYLGIQKATMSGKYQEAFNAQVMPILFLILLATLGVAMWLAKSISLPLSVMEKTISKIGEGDLSGRLDYTKYEELNHLVEAYNMMANTLQRMYATLEVQVQERTKELKNAYAELQNTQAMMVHSEKMKSLGELVAGIMHEINNPINFIYGNMTHLSNYSNDLINIIEEYTKYSASLKPEEKEDIDKLKEEIDYEFLKTDMPDLIKSCKEGADRAKNIIQDLKSFSRMEEVAITDVDIIHEIDTTLNILHNKLKNKAQIHKEYEEPIPKIEAFGGQLNQVFMNILDNAGSAIEKTGDIWIRLKPDFETNCIVIEIEDNGIGMDKETASKVFDPFFTTKPVGQGTGLGMSITHKIIKNHQGSIRLESEKGKGSKFIISLPIKIDRESLNGLTDEAGETVNG